MRNSAFRSVLALSVLAACAAEDDPEQQTTDTPADSSGDPGSASASATQTPDTDDSASASATATEPTTAGTDDDGDSTGADEDLVVVPLRIDAFNVPTIETYYACFEFKFELDQLGHIVGFDPVIDDVAHVHHYVLTKLDEPSGQPDGYSCFDLSGEMIYTWAPGGQAYDLPPEAGFLIGDAPGGKVTLRLQVHYNNPVGDTGVTDSSGLDLRVSKALRPHDAGTIVFGDIENIEIPPGMPAYEHVATCSSNATASLLTEPMNVFGTAMHAHNIGSVLWTDVYRDGEKIYELNRDDPYLFGSQHMNPSDKVIEPGDEVRTHCIYDSSERTETTLGGPGTLNEMCWNVVTYWPRITQPIDTCGTGN